MFLPYRLLAIVLQRTECWKSFLEYDRILQKRERTLCRIDFLEKCWQADIIPKFLKFRVPNNGCFEPTTVHNFQRRLLKNELAKARSTLKEHEKSVNNKRSKLNRTVDEILLPSIVLYTRISKRKCRETVLETQRNKLSILSADQDRPLLRTQDTVRLFDIDIVPPKYVMDTLALGPKNSVLTKFDQKDTLAEIDSLLHKLDNLDTPNEAINNINAATLNYIKRCSKQKVPRYITMTKRFLKEHELLAIPFDKGTGICLMKSTTYKSKIDDILQLRQFKKIQITRKNAKNMSVKEEERVNDKLQELLDANEIDETLFEEIKSMGGQLPRLYGLAKVHKPNVPIRPVLSMPGSPYYKIAEKVTKWLSVIPESKINCSTKETVDQLKNVTLDPDEVVISFDVSSLYTNVPVNEAIQDAADRLYSGNFPTPPVSKETFTTLTKLSTTNVIVSTHDGLYRQIDGLAMGSQPAPPLANIWLSKFESDIKDDAKIFKRYMDDILRTIKAELIEAKLQAINDLHPNLKFTIEVEEEGRLPFLDMRILHVDNHLHSTWYTKPTDTSLIMNFHGLAPKRYKRSVVEGFVHRVYRTCSHWKYFNDSLNKAKDILERNQYPPQFYEPIINSTIEKLVAPVVNVQDENAKRKSNVMMYVSYRGHVTDMFVKKLKESGAPVQPIVTLRKLKTVMPSLKTTTKFESRSRVVYKITCPGCETCYVGQTRRHLLTRFREHNYKKAKAVYKHFRNCVGSDITLDDVKILAQTSRKLHYLLSLEALFIREHNPALNVKDEYHSRELIIRF